MSDEKTSIPDKKWTTRWAIVLALATVVLAITGIVGLIEWGIDRAYQSGKDSGAATLAQCKAEQKVDFETLVTKAETATDKLGQATKGFSALLRDNEEYEFVKKRADELQTTNKKMATEIQSGISKVTGLQTELDKKSAELEQKNKLLEEYKVGEKIYSVALHSSIKIPSSNITIGVIDITPESATINVNGQPRPLQAGQGRTFADAKTACTITLRSIDDLILNFSAKCEAVTQLP